MVLISPLILIGYWWGLLAMLVVMCVLLVCIGKPKAAWEMTKTIPLMPPGWRAALVLPQTGLAKRAFRFATQRW